MAGMLEMSFRGELDDGATTFAGSQMLGFLRRAWRQNAEELFRPLYEINF